MLPWVGPQIPESQCGSGLNGAECAATHLTIRALTDYAQLMGLTFSGVFLDIATAYSKVLKPVIFMGHVSEPKVIKMLLDGGFSENDIRDIMQQADQYAQWGEAPAHIIEMAKAMTSFHWAAFDGSAGVVLPLSGVQAGVTLADIISIMAVARVTSIVKQKVVAAGIPLQY